MPAPTLAPTTAALQSKRSACAILKTRLVVCEGMIAMNENGYSFVIQSFVGADLLAGTAVLLLSGGLGRAPTISGQLPWAPNAGNPPTPVKPGPWLFFTGAEGRAMEAIADRIIPPNPETQAARMRVAPFLSTGSWLGRTAGRDELHLRPSVPTRREEPRPAVRSRSQPRTTASALAALDNACKSKYAGKTFAEFPTDDKDTVLRTRKRRTQARRVDGKAFFEQVVKDVQMGFFADPIYGGNRDMVAWKMIGYPGARYNYLDWVSRHNERFPLPPVSIPVARDWTPKTR